MDTSVTIIGLIILVIILIPIFFMLRSQALNKSKIKALLAANSLNNHFDFSLTETQNKKVLALDQKNKGFVLIDFNYDAEEVYFSDLTTINNCKLIPTTESNSATIVRIEFELESKVNAKKSYIPFYDIDKDQLGQVCLFEDHQLAKKWAQLIQNTIS